MVTRYGMDEHLGHATYETERQTFLGMQPMPAEQHVLGEQTVQSIDEAVRTIVGAAFDRARALLERHRKVLEEGAELLLKQETLDKKDLEALAAKLPATAGVRPLAV